MKRAVVIGGYGESECQLEPIAEAACEAFNVNDAAIFTLVNADKNPNALIKAVEDAAVNTHSLGVSKVPLTANPELLMVFNGPEPHRIGSLFLSAGQIALKHAQHAIIGSNFTRNITTARDTLGQLASHPLEHLSYIPGVANFSSTRRVARMAESGLNVKLVAAEDDEFFAPLSYISAARKILPRIVDLQIIPGNHTTLLRRPGEVFARTLFQ
ncbi:MAG: hypothetical protein U5K77_02330 [Candidatus Saccharibacteria bacterium]|nr:hypothetical protein [Candidatus Saccharibacteria bacterium]